MSMDLVARRARSARRRRPSAASWPSARACPEDVFFVWLLRLPDGADIARAAREEIARLDRAAPLPPGAVRLRELMVAASKAGPSPAS